FILVRHSFVLGQNPASNAVVLQGISGQYDGKSASRLRTKPSGELYSAFPQYKTAGQALYRRTKAYFNPSNRIHIFHFGNLCKKGTSQNTKSML
ncbi:hypothetical protein, partial [Ruminococcus sp.]